MADTQTNQFDDFLMTSSLTIDDYELQQPLWAMPLGRAVRIMVCPKHLLNALILPAVICTLVHLHTSEEYIGDVVRETTILWDCR